MPFTFDVVDTARREEPDLFGEQMTGQVRDTLAEAVECEVQFAPDLLGQGVAALSLDHMRGYLRHVAADGSPNSASSRHTAPRTRWPSWTCEMSRNYLGYPPYPDKS